MIDILHDGRETREKISDKNAIPHNFRDEGLIVMPTGGPPPAGHPESLPGEPALFHEDGHILADQVGIRIGNNFVNELIAPMFAVAYMAAERSDRSWVLEDLRSGRSKALVLNPPGYTPRYQSLADLDYLYMGVGDANYVWFQQAVLGRLADLLRSDESFRVVAEKLQKAFPAAEQKRKPTEEIGRELDRHSAGLSEDGGFALRADDDPADAPSACPELTTQSRGNWVVVQNNTANPLVAVPNPPENGVTIPAHSWSRYWVLDWKLPDGSCLVPRDEPTLVVIDKQ